MQRRGRDNDAAGLVFAEECGVFLVDRSPVVDVRRVDAAEDDVVGGDACCIKHTLDVVQSQTGVLADVALADFTRIRINRELAGNVERAVGDDAGAVVTFVFAFEVGSDDLHGKSSFGWDFYKISLSAEKVAN